MFSPIGSINATPYMIGENERQPSHSPPQPSPSPPVSHVANETNRNRNHADIKKLGLPPAFRDRLLGSDKQKEKTHGHLPHRYHPHFSNSTKTQFQGEGSLDAPTLVQEINEKLNHLGKPEGGWYFEQLLGPLRSLTMDHVKGIYEILEKTNDVKNIMSFGARDGGFELTMQIRHDFDLLMGVNQKSGNSLSHNYLDAISLKKNRYTQLLKMEGVDILKMQNPFWDIGYKNGIENAERIIFFITPEWLDSSFCRQEFQWLDETKNKSIKAAFVIFDDVDKNNETVKNIIDFSAQNKSYVLDVRSDDDTPHRVSIEGSKDLVFRRSISSNMFEQLKRWLLTPSGNR